MGDLFGVVLTVLLIAANAFFVGAEFALISARRDRLEALAEQGKHSAVTVIRAGENLAVMLAGAQLGITIGSIFLGRVGEPAVAHLLSPIFELLGVPDAVLHTVSFCTYCSARWCRRTSHWPAPKRSPCCWSRRTCCGSS
jgi:CBS domain containing-hemolysin-like protein